MLKSTIVSKPLVCPGLKTQSPATLRWRLRVEVGAPGASNNGRVGPPLGLMDPAAAGPLPKCMRTCRIIDLRIGRRHKWCPG